MRVDRREFLRQAGLGTVAAGMLPALINAFASSASAQGQRGFAFLAVSAAGPAGTAAQPQHTIAMGGEGTFDPSRPGSRADGGGTFFHFTTPGTPPLPVVGAGRWQARLLVNYREIGTYAGHAAGVADLVVDIFRQLPSPAVFRGALLTISCNIGAAGLQTGNIEGYTLSIPGTEFSAGGTPGPFRPLPPGGVGLTIFRVG
jgi:hypothetical protein